jgi:L-ascorbate metabolism protein UlaG (beta-lactamase superfamily)
MVSVRWTGAAGLEFTYEGKTWLIDPYLSRISKMALFFGRPQPDRETISRYLDNLSGSLQAVIVGHTHLDHALDVPEIIERFPVPLLADMLVNPNFNAQMQRWGRRSEKKPGFPSEYTRRPQDRREHLPLKD